MYYVVCEVCTEFLYEIQISKGGVRFDPRSVHVGFVVDKVALGQVFPPEYFGSPLSISFHRAPLQVKTNHLYHRVAQ
jgi:hypothetical protein